MKVSIITVVFNGAKTVEHCINSVISQSHKAIEHIIIDGGSTDGTLKITDKYSSNIAKVISEPDNGIYDAMNKGITLATGQIVGILNSDDFYVDENVLSRVAETFNNADIDSCYGDLVYVDPENTDKVLRYWKSSPYNEKLFHSGGMPPHPTFFVRRSIYEKYGSFNTDLSQAADYELMLRFMVRHGITTIYIPEVLVKMRTGGMSNVSVKNRLKANLQDRQAWKINGLKPMPWTLYMKPLSKVGQYLFHRPY